MNATERSPAIRVEGVSHAYGRERVLRDVDLALAEGRTTILLGTNGAGKTTLLKLLLGTLRPTTGRIDVLGLDPIRNARRLRRRIGYVPDRPDAPRWMTLAELCAFTKAHQPDWDDALVADLLATFGLNPRARLGTLSRGKGMLAMLTLALGPRPALLLLDEPFGGLDPLVRDEVLRAILASGDAGPRTILCATHDLDVAARLADDVAVLADGQIRSVGPLATDPAAETVHTTDSLRQTLAEAVPC